MKLLPLLIGLFLNLTLSGQPGSARLKISHLTGDFYIYTTSNVWKASVVDANSMYEVTDSGVVLFDTPWDTTQFQPLLDSIETRHGKKVVICIATHYHEDRTGGLGFLQEKGIKTYTSKQTYDLCKQHNMKQADHIFEKDTVFTIGHSSFQTYYAGEGHTKDNIVIWFEKEKILYGGCLIKSTQATNLGNLKDANLDQWPATIRKIKLKFPKAVFIVPGHQDWRNPKSLDHTLALLKLHHEKK